MTMSLYTRQCNANLDLINCNSNDPSKWVVIVGLLIGVIFLLLCFTTLFWVYYVQRRKEKKESRKAKIAQLELQLQEQKLSQEKSKS